MFHGKFVLITEEMLYKDIANESFNNVVRINKFYIYNENRF